MTTPNADEIHIGAADSIESAKRSRRRVMSRVSIQSKLLVMLLLTSILSAAIVGAIGYQSGRSSLRASVFDRLTEIRESQSRSLQIGIKDLKNSLVVYSRGSTATMAIGDFTAGFDQLANAAIDPAQQQSLNDYYVKRFAKDEAAQTGEEVDVKALLPTTGAARYLQSFYTVPFGDYGQPTADWTGAIDNDDARATGDDSFALFSAIDQGARMRSLLEPLAVASRQKEGVLF